MTCLLTNQRAHELVLANQKAHELLLANKRAPELVLANQRAHELVLANQRPVFTCVGSTQNRDTRVACPWINKKFFAEIFLSPFKFVTISRYLWI